MTLIIFNIIHILLLPENTRYW